MIESGTMLSCQNFYQTKRGGVVMLSAGRKSSCPLSVVLLGLVPTGRVVGLAPKWGRLDPKLDKSGTFSDHRAKCTENEN